MSGDNWYSEDCETYADYKFKQEQEMQRRDKIVEDLLSALRAKRKAFQERVITFDAWFHERQMIMREAEFHGVTDALLDRAGEG